MGGIETRTKWTSKRSPLARLYTESLGRLQTLKFQKEISLYGATL
jgi:hypothetical protein